MYSAILQQKHNTSTHTQRHRNFATLTTPMDCATHKKNRQYGRNNWAERKGERERHTRGRHMVWGRETEMAICRVHANEMKTYGREGKLCIRLCNQKLTCPQTVRPSPRSRWLPMQSASHCLCLRLWKPRASTWPWPCSCAGQAG